MEFSDYMPHGMCLLWQPWLLLLWAGSDLLIFASYFVIPVALMRVVRGRTDLKHRGLVMLFASFILLCGLTHLFSIVTLWWPIYPFVGALKLLTGTVSAITAVTLFRLVPTLVSLPGVGDLEATNARLRAEIAAHEATLKELTAIRAELEDKVERRTAELKTANTRMATVAREAIHRSGNLLAVVGSVVRQSAKSASSVDDLAQTLSGRLNALSAATAAVAAAERGSSDLGQVLRRQLDPLLLTYDERVKIEGPKLATNAEAAQQLSLAVHELATNAQKYGGLSEGSGGVRVSWELDETGGSRVFVFHWEETGVPADAALDEPDDEGFGTRLLMTIVPTMLQGTAERGVVDGTLRYTLRMPADALKPDVSWQQGSGMAAEIVDAEFAAGPA